MDSLRLRVFLDIKITPPADSPPRDTEEAFEIGRVIAAEAHKAAKRLAPPGSIVVIDRQITA